MCPMLKYKVVYNMQGDGFMIKSMTGYGRGEVEEFGRNFTVEIKSVNHRYSDISIKLPRQISYLEDKIKKQIMQHISRGKIDVYIMQNKFNAEDISVTVDDSLAMSYLKALYELRDKFNLKDDITVSTVSRVPDLLTVSKADEDSDEIWGTLSKAIDMALNEFIEMREREGRKLAEDIEGRVQYIKAVVKNIEDRSPYVVEEYRSKLEERINEILKDVCIDENRLATEIAIFADKSNITEEIVRLYSHLDQTAIILKADEPSGRKLDFLVQEMNREINTIGSKASDLSITKNVVEVKGEIEKIREQIQNIE